MPAPGLSAAVLRECAGTGRNCRTRKRGDAPGKAARGDFAEGETAGDVLLPGTAVPRVEGRRSILFSGPDFRARKVPSSFPPRRGRKFSVPRKGGRSPGRGAPLRRKGRRNPPSRKKHKVMLEVSESFFRDGEAAFFVRQCPCRGRRSSPGERGLQAQSTLRNRDLRKTPRRLLHGSCMAVRHLFAESALTRSRKKPPPVMRGGGMV